MTHKSIIYSDHAAAQRRARGIRRTDVRFLIARGVRIPAGTRRGAEQRWEVRGPVGNQTLRVIFIERAAEIEIVTVEWKKEER